MSQKWLHAYSSVNVAWTNEQNANVKDCDVICCNKNLDDEIKKFCKKNAKIRDVKMLKTILLPLETVQ